jgi:predicted transcriptional regulator YheO
VPKRRYSPPTPEVAARIAAMVDLYRKQQEIEAKYKAALGELADKDGDYKVPIAHLAEQLGIERKTVYRHLGQSMT